MKGKNVYLLFFINIHEYTNILLKNNFIYLLFFFRSDDHETIPASTRRYSHGGMNYYNND